MYNYHKDIIEQFVSISGVYTKTCNYIYSENDVKDDGTYIYIILKE